MPPGKTVAFASSLLKVKSGAALTGVVSLAALLPGCGSAPCVPSSAMLALLLSCVTPAATGLTTVTAKVTVPLPPLLTLPRFKVQVLPALWFGRQTQPPVLTAALNVVCAGTVSVNTTPVALSPPVFA